MASFSSITPQQVIDRANRPPSAYGRQDNAAVLALVAELGILEAAKGIANSRADSAASPYDFPFSRSVLQKARPNATDEQIEEYAGQQTALFEKYILDDTAGELLLSTIRRTNQDGDTDQVRSDRLKAGAATALEAAVAWSQGIAADAVKGGAVESDTDLVAAFLTIELDSPCVYAEYG